MTQTAALSEIEEAVLRDLQRHYWKLFWVGVVLAVIPFVAWIGIPMVVLYAYRIRKISARLRAEGSVGAGPTTWNGETNRRQ